MMSLAAIRLRIPACCSLYSLAAGFTSFVGPAPCSANNLMCRPSFEESVPPMGTSSCTSRSYSSEPASSSTSVPATPSAASARVKDLADQIVGLTVLECSQLTELVRSKLGMQKPTFNSMPMMAAPAPGPATPAAAAPAAPAAKADKTDFDVKLESFSAEGKIKVIKEVRTLTALGLKEAKELVEKAPVVVKSGMSKADAEAVKKQLEAAGGKVSLE